MATDDTGLHLRPLPRIGQELGRFIIERELPRGGQARVYRAWQTDLQRPVALKLLPSSYVAEGEALTRFRREIENVARINHPNIVRVFEAGELLGNPFFTMDYIEGNDAETILKRGPFDPDEAATVMEAIARAVAEAHGQGIIHRDIKPGNIIVRRDGTPVLTDFGLAQDLTNSAQLTQTGVSMGTPAYMAPEQARGERNRVGVKSDVFSLGATLYTLLTAKRPVEGESAYELMLKVAESEGPKWPRYAIESVPPDLRAIVEMAMAPDPARRYDSAAALADDLERYLHGEWVVARTRGKLARLWLRTRRYAPVAAVIVIALGLAGGMVYTGLNPGMSDNSVSGPLEIKELLEDDSTADELVALFEPGGTWTQRGGTIMQGPGGELVLLRTGDEQLFISPREPACWGQFTLQSDIRVQQPEGPLDLLIGMSESYRPEDTAYIIRLGAGSRDRVELLRLGVPVVSIDRADQLPLLMPNVWYRATIERSGQVLRFTLARIGEAAQVASFTFEDTLPAFAGDARERFAVQAEAAELGLRGVSTTRRAFDLPEEELMFSLGHYHAASRAADLRLSGLATSGPEAVEERARLLFLRARCHERLGRMEEALRDCEDAKRTSDNSLRARVFVFASGLLTAMGDDQAALAQLNAARLNASRDSVLSSVVLHSAANRADGLARTDQPERALPYYDMVNEWALGHPGLVCYTLWRDAELRLDLAQRAEGDLPEFDPAQQRAQALENLERIESAAYRRFGSVHAPAMIRLFSLVRDDADDIARPARVADSMALAVGAYGADNAALTDALVAASWLGRLGGGPTDLGLSRRAEQWLEAAGRAGGDPVWTGVQMALFGQERPELTGDREARRARWVRVQEQLMLEEPGHALPSALVEFFVGFADTPDDARRREDNLRRAVRAAHADVAPHWLAGASADAFSDYCIALLVGMDERERAISLLQRAAGDAQAGDFSLLDGRAAAWLPVQR